MQSQVQNVGIFIVCLSVYTLIRLNHLTTD